MLPEGYYKAKAIPTSAEFGVSPAKGTRFVRIPFQVTDGEHKGSIVTWDGYFTDGSTQRTIEGMQYAGCTFPDNDVTNLVGLGSTECQIDVEHSSYEKDGQTKTFARVAWVNSLLRGINPEAQMDAGAKAAFKQSMMGAVALAKQPKSANGGASPSTAQAAAAGTKVPFDRF